MNYDYTFCVDKSCDKRDCERHWTKIPVGIPVSVSDLGRFRGMDGWCDYHVIGLVKKTRRANK